MNELMNKYAFVFGVLLYAVFMKILVGSRDHWGVIPNLDVSIPKTIPKLSMYELNMKNELDKLLQFAPNALSYSPLTKES